jgi:tRNA threonylcarbamoyladenosine biosynthesis protein TsaB
VLGIETTTSRLGLALTRDRQGLGELDLDLGRKHCEKILVGLDGLLSDLGVRVSELDGIAVSQGPGSFTGVRIGLAFAQGLAVAGGLQLAGVPTLEAIAHGAALWQGPLVACLDARRGEVYFCSYRRVADRVEPLADEVMVGSAERVAAHCAALGPRVLVVGAGAEQVRGAAGPEIVFAPAELGHPRARFVAALGAERLARGEGQEPEHVEPIYVRRSDAEIRRGAMAGRT